MAFGLKRVKSSVTVESVSSSESNQLESEREETSSVLELTGLFWGLKLNPTLSAQDDETCVTVQTLIGLILHLFIIWPDI